MCSAWLIILGSMINLNIVFFCRRERSNYSHHFFRLQAHKEFMDIKPNFTIATLLTTFIFRRLSEQQSSPPQQQQHHRTKAAQLPFCINDSLALAHKHYNQKKIKQIRFLFKHRENCLLKKTNLVKRFQSQPNIYRNWNCEDCGL